MADGSATDAAQEQLRRSLGLALVPFRWDLLGFGLCRAQATALLAFAANEIWISGESFAVQEAVFVLAGVVSLVIALCARHRKETKASTGAVMAFVTIGVLGIVSIMIGKSDGSPVLLLVGFAFAGASAGFFETAWGPKFVRLSPSGIQLYTLFAMAVSSLFGVMLLFLPRNGFYLASLTLLGAQAALLLVHSKAELDEEHADRASAVEDSARRAQAAYGSQALSSSIAEALSGDSSGSSATRMVRTILATTLAFSFIYNMFITLAYSSLPSDAASQIRFWANLLAACVIICSFLLLRPVRPTTLFRLVLPVVTLGFVLFLLSPGLLGEGALMASSVGRKFFDIFVWIIVAQAALLPAVGTWRSFGLLTAAKNFGYGIGLFAAHAALAAVDAEIVQVAAIVAVLILGLVVLLSWLFPERMLGRTLSAAAPPSSSGLESAFEAAVGRIAEQGRLTPRESEVMALLVRGRNIPAIAEKLCISKGTAHTHAAHVYQKLGVHRQQELIDLVDRDSSGGEVPAQSDN